MKNWLVLLSVMLFGFSAMSQTVQLEGLYATSTALPFDDFDVTNVFDEDVNTYWKTITGAGPDEGIMIYFAEQTYLSKVEVITHSGFDIASITRLEVYGDGKTFYSGEVIDEPLKSLYIKISDTNAQNSISHAYQGKDYTQFLFEKMKSVAIAEIKLIGENGKTLKVLPPSFVNGSIDASSSLVPNLAYGPENVMDSKKDFGWAEGASSSGEGESLIFETDEAITVTALKIWNGYQRSSNHYKSNTRLKRFEMSDEQGNVSEYEIIDFEEPQFVKLTAPLTGKKFKLKVISVYPGSKYKDLVISELKFYKGDLPMIIKTKTQEERVKALKNQSNALLSQFLDRNVKVRLSQETNREIDGLTVSKSSGNTSSLILRSNHSFVLYQTEYFYEEGYSEEDYYEDYGDKTTIADGNWELKEEGEDYIKIRIFGKIFSPTTSAELYQGDVTSMNVRIFQDILTITKDKIKGQRSIDEIFIKQL